MIVRMKIFTIKNFKIIMTKIIKVMIMTKIIKIMIKKIKLTMIKRIKVMMDDSGEGCNRDFPLAT